MALSRAIGSIMSKVILTLLWIFVFGAYAVVLRVIALFRRREGRSVSAWRDLPPDDPQGLRHQF
jgi:hypothetical protein